MSKLLKENINEIKKISSIIPKNINEAMNFEQFEQPQGDMYEDDEEELMDKHDMGKNSDSSDNGVMDVMAFVDDIRKKALKGMAQLAENPDDERYQLLKKIWQICDKKPEQQTAFSNPNQQQAQQMQRRPMSDREMR